MIPEGHEITVLLGRLGKGDKDAESRVVGLLYRELHALAERRLYGEQKAVSLRATELVNEAYLRLLAESDRTFNNRIHFFASAARVMRNVLIDYIRARAADRRGGGLVRVELEDGVAVVPGRADEAVALHEALDRLEALDPEQARLVELRYFAGFTMEEIATITGQSVRTVHREWGLARKWLYSELSKAGFYGPRTVEPD